MTRHRTPPHRCRASQHGVALVSFALTAGAFIALTVVGVDLARLAFTGTELQQAADVAATAGAKALAINAATGWALDAVAEAQTASAQNSVDGHAVAIPAGDIAIGHYDFASNGFVAGGTPNNAIRVNANATVNNFVAGALGDPTTTVSRTATAAYGGVASGRPVLPIAIGDCEFAPFTATNNCSDLPKLTQAPSLTDNSCWTSLGPSAASANESRHLLPTACCSGSQCGGGETPPAVDVGDLINTMNGQTSVLLQIIGGCLDNGLRDFVVPVVRCGTCTGAMEVVGFATMHIDDVHATGSEKGIDLTGICKADAAGPVGDTNFGTISQKLVQ